MEKKDFSKKYFYELIIPYECRNLTSIYLHFIFSSDMHVFWELL